MLYRIYTQQSCTTAKKVYVKQKCYDNTEGRGGNWYLSFNHLQYI